MVLDAAWLIPALPLTGFVLLLVFGRRLGDPWAGWLATAMTAAAFVVSIVMFASLLGRSADDRSFTQELFTWLPVGGLQVKAGLLLDPLSITMALFITGVGALIHLYSIGYMHGDEGYPRFFVYLNLFAFSMLVLVLADNFLLSFLGWEGVGACSYFLISFWFERDTAASAGKKAFVTNRVGDFGFMIAMFLMFSALGSLQYGAVFAGAETLSKTTATAIALLLFLGAVGKSAQLPLYVWLPDAMEGPTPVSALIHAATMVTAGVYLMCRINPILELAPGALDDHRRRRRRHRVVRGHHRLRPERHQAGARVLDDLPARLHVPRRGLGRLRGRGVPHGHARLLQGAPLPRRRLGDPRPARRAGHEAHGQPAPLSADHVGHVHRGLARHRRHPALRRVLVEGRHPGQRLRHQQAAVAHRRGDRAAHRVLHEPPGVHGVLRRGA